MRHRWFGHILLAYCALCYLSGPSHAWSPRTHVLTANETILDAQDGALCLPQLGRYNNDSELWAQLPIGSTPLYKWVYIPPTEENGDRWVVLNEWVRMAPYIRAGAVGPDGVPDPIMGQQLTHVDHSQDVPFDAAGFLDALLDDDVHDDENASFALRNYRDDFEAIIATLGTKPTWRSIDWAHEVLREALNFNQAYLGSLSTYRLISAERRTA